MLRRNPVFSFCLSVTGPAVKFSRHLFGAQDVDEDLGVHLAHLVGQGAHQAVLHHTVDHGAGLAVIHPNPLQQGGRVVGPPDQGTDILHMLATVSQPRPQ